MPEAEVKTEATTTTETSTTEQEAQATETGATDPKTTTSEADSESLDDIPEFGESDAADLSNDDEDDDLPEEAEVAAELPEPKTKVEPEGEAPKVEEKPEAKTPAEVPTAEKPEGEKAVEVVKPETKPEPIPIPTETKPAQAPAETPSAEPTPALTPEETKQSYEDWRGGIEETLATTRYAITEEEAQELDLTEAQTKFISKGLSRVYMDAVTGAIGHVVATMPQLLASAMQNQEAHAAAEVDFYTSWPQLNGKDHGETIARIGHAYRNLNPSVTKEIFIRDVGAQVILALKVPDAVTAAPAAATEPVVAAQPFVPAGSGAPGGGPAAPVNVYTELSEEFDEDDLAEHDG